MQNYATISLKLICKDACSKFRIPKLYLVNTSDLFTNMRQCFVVSLTRYRLKMEPMFNWLFFGKTI